MKYNLPTIFALALFLGPLTCLAQEDKQETIQDEKSTPTWQMPNEFIALQQTEHWPDIIPENRPGAIWWWPASAVSKSDLTWNLETYSRAGWGNMGIVGIYGVKGEEDRTIELFSPKWFEMYNHTNQEAKRLGINLDLTPGGGWRWGGPHVTEEHADQQFAVNDGLIFGKKLKEKVKRAGPGGMGLTVNPYSQSAVRFHLDWFDEKMDANKALAPRSFYYDSFENSGNWCDEFLEYFESRRGYSLTDHVSVFDGDAKSEDARRVLCDYRETLSEMLIARMREIADWSADKGSKLRVQAHGAPANLLDLYAAGSIPETEVFGASKFDIPGFRREGKWIRADQQSDLVNRFASSAAHVAGHPITTSESFTWLRNHYHTALSHVKAEADGLLLNGINGIYYHGACFSPQSTQWPGWLFYASTQANPRNSIFRDVPVLNSYITRCQSILQAGKPHNDILLYWPVHDLWMNGGKGDQRYTVHHPEWIEETSCGEAGRHLLKHGYTFDFVSDLQINNSNSNNGKVVTEGDSQYQTILIPSAKYIPVSTAKKIVELAKSGATVLVWKSLPGNVPGWLDHANRKAQIDEIWSHVKLDSQGLAQIGTGRIIVNSDLNSLLSAADIKSESMTELGLEFIRRTSESEVQYFIVNHTTDAVDDWVPLATLCESVLLMDPMTSRTGLAKIKTGEENSVYLQMQPGETRILRVSSEQAFDATPWNYVVPSTSIPVKGQWDLKFVDGGPVLPADAQLDQLESWTTLDDRNTKSFAGTGRYTIEMDVPETDGNTGWVLDLGDVRESARVWLNGKPIGAVVAHPFRVDLGNNVRAGINKLEIEVTNLSVNRIRDLDIRGVNWKKFHDINFVSHLYRPFDASKWDLKSSGLLGPVSLIPYKNKIKFEIATLHLIGDSTVKTGQGKGGRGQWGWGSVIHRHFDSNKIQIANHAIGGLSSRTYLTGGHWKKVRNELKPGDFVLMQFGHNDGGEKFKGNRPRASIKGNGNDSVEGIVELTGQHEVVHSYGWYLRQFISETIEKGATPIVFSPVPRKKWVGDKMSRASDDYALWARQAAESCGANFIDLNDIVATRYEALGKTQVENLFADEHTHTSLAGAKVNATCVVTGIKQIANTELLNCLKAKPTLYLMGDSTVRNGHGDQVGWGEVIGKHFDIDEINLVNAAIAGRSTRTFMREKRWQKIHDQLKPGDFVIMQFGHNDGGRVGDLRFKQRPSLPGIGEDSQRVQLENGSSETVHTYGWYLKQFCNGVKRKGATPIICSPVPHKDNWNDKIFTADFVDHRKWCREVAKMTRSIFVDLTAIIGDRYQAMGEEKATALFADVRTHTNHSGAEINAECVIAGLKILKGNPFGKFLASNRVETLKPSIGWHYSARFMCE